MDRLIIKYRIWRYLRFIKRCKGKQNDLFIDYLYNINKPFQH